MEKSTIKIIDFGFGKMALPESLMHTRCGTPYYICPQLLTGVYDRSCGWVIHNVTDGCQFSSLLDPCLLSYISLLVCGAGRNVSPNGVSLRLSVPRLSPFFWLNSKKWWVSCDTSSVTQRVSMTRRQPSDPGQMGAQRPVNVTPKPVTCGAVG